MHSTGSGRRPRRQPGPRLGGARLGDAAEVVNDLRRLFKAIQEYSKAVLKETGLSGPQLWALSVLREAPALSLGDLSERLFAHPSTVCGIVDRLEEKGAVRREADPADGRGVRLRLTSRGRRVAGQSPPPVQAGLRRALSAMPARQLRQLRRSLDHLVRGVSAQHVDAPFFDLAESPRGRHRSR